MHPRLETAGGSRVAIHRISKGFVVPSGVYTLKPCQLKFYNTELKTPETGDVVYGRIKHIGQHSSLENRSGRIHAIHGGTTGIFVYGNRYAPDYYEAFVPEAASNSVDLIARSGIIGSVSTKNARIKDPTTIEILGYVCTEEGQQLNTIKFPLITAKQNQKKYPRSRMILVCGTTMNSGKSAAAAACCWVLSNLGYKVKGAKITGTASLKDILHMNDAGAQSFSDFSFLGYPSTYLLEEKELLHVFDTLDLKYANNPANYWVVELADGINQRETALLLQSENVKQRIHRLVFCANDAFSSMGGVEYLKQRYDLRPNLISGVCTSSPLHMREISHVIDIPIFDAMNIDLKYAGRLLLA